MLIGCISLILIIFTFPLIPFIVIRGIQKRYHAKVPEHPDGYHFGGINKYLEISSYIVKHFNNRNKNCKVKGFYFSDTPILEQINYNIKSETKLNILICMLFYYSINLFGISGFFILFLSFIQGNFK